MLDKGIRFQGLFQLLVINLAVDFKIWRQVLLGIAIATSAFYPNRPRAQLFPQRLQDANFVIDAIDLNFALVIRFANQVYPVIRKNTVDNQLLVRVVVASGAVAIAVE